MAIGGSLWIAERPKPLIGREALVDPQLDGQPILWSLRSSIVGIEWVYEACEVDPPPSHSIRECRGQPSWRAFDLGCLKIPSLSLLLH